MSSATPTSFLKKSPQHQQKINPRFLSNRIISTSYKPLILCSLFLLIIYTYLLSNRNIDQSPQYLRKLRQIFYPQIPQGNDRSYGPTNISHIVISIASSINSYETRKAYIESWWRSNATKGYVYLDDEPINFQPWLTTWPPYRIYENTTRYEPYDRHLMKHAIRMVRVIVQTFKEIHDEEIRWYIIADDDTILFLDNLVDILRKYDHRKYFYIGDNSETVVSNREHSFEMAFGGAGYAVSYPLAEALYKNMDVCIKRYPDFYGASQILQSCASDLGVSLTHQKGFHQIDLHADLSGFLSSHPQAPLVSLHHLDLVEPIFPNMNRYAALNHLMKAAKEDQPRLLQQTICYDNTKNWSFSIAWGYTAEIYEQIMYPSVLQRPLETFTAWMEPAIHSFMFNTRWLSNNPCEIPHVFYLQSVKRVDAKNQIVTTYTRRSPRDMPSCAQLPTPSDNDNSFSLPSDITKIRVISPTNKYFAEEGTRRECCDVLDQVAKSTIKIRYRACLINEIVGIH